MKFLKVFESWKGEYEIPTYSELVKMINSGEVHINSHFDKPYSLSDEMIHKKICEPSQIQDLGHDYHDYSWVIHPEVEAVEEPECFVYFTLFEDDKVVGNYTMMKRFYLFGDVLILYHTIDAVFINLMTNKSSYSSIEKLMHQPLLIESGEYEFRCENRTDGRTGLDIDVLICTNKSYGKVVELDISVCAGESKLRRGIRFGPIWDKQAEPLATYKLSDK